MSNYKEFQDINHGISLKYPEEWTYQTDDSVGLTIFARPETLANFSNATTDPVFNIVCTKLPKSVSPDLFINGQLDQMRQMSTNPLNIEEINISGVTAKKVMTEIRHESLTMKFFSVLATYNGTGYSFLFHCKKSAMKEHAPILKTILESLKFRKFASKLLNLVPYVVEKCNLLVRYPADYEVVKSDDDDGSKPVVTFTSKTLDDDQNELKTDIKVVIQERQGPLSLHVDKMKENLERMLVDEVDITNFTIGSKPAVSFAWKNEAKLKNGYFLHILTSETESSPIVAISCVSNFIESESRITEVLKAVRTNIRFLSDPEFNQATLNWRTHIILNHNIGLHYNPEHFAVDNVPLTEGSFVMKEDEDKESPRSNFAIMVKDATTVPQSLKDMENELVRNINELCENNVKIIESKSVNILGQQGRYVIFKGEAFSPISHTRESLIFVYKFFTMKRRAITFAFAANPSIWEAEWEKANASIDTIFFY